MAALNHRLDVLIIGAGQAGLAMGYHLKHTPLSFRLVERHARIGNNWRARYNSLVLFTPRVYSSLPGLSMPGDPNAYASKDEFADYSENPIARPGIPPGLVRPVWATANLLAGPLYLLWLIVMAVLMWRRASQVMAIDPSLAATTGA